MGKLKDYMLVNGNFTTWFNSSLSGISAEATIAIENALGHGFKHYYTDPLPEGNFLLPAQTLPERYYMIKLYSGVRLQHENRMKVIR